MQNRAIWIANVCVCYGKNHVTVTHFVHPDRDTLSENM